jgi:hypothetical protein
MVGELLGGALILIGIILLLMRGQISHRNERTGGTGLSPAGEGLLFGDRRRLLLVCSLLVVGGTALVLGGALA